MARPKGRPKTSQRRDSTVKIDARIVGMAKVIATAEGVSVAELLSEMLRVPIERKYSGVMANLRHADE